MGSMDVLWIFHDFFMTFLAFKPPNSDIFWNRQAKAGGAAWRFRRNGAASAR